jgi:hypothetical protein
MLVFMHNKTCTQFIVLILISIDIVYSPAGWVPPPFRLTSYIPTKSHLYPSSSLETVIREPALYILRTFHVPNLVSIIRRLDRLSKEPALVRGSLIRLVTRLFYGGDVSPTLEDHSLSFVRSRLFNIFTATLHRRRPSLHLQPEYASCCGDKGPT